MNVVNVSQRGWLCHIRPYCLGEFGGLADEGADIDAEGLGDFLEGADGGAIGISLDAGDLGLGHFELGGELFLGEAFGDAGFGDAISCKLGFKILKGDPLYFVVVWHFGNGFVGHLRSNQLCVFLQRHHHMGVVVFIH